MSMLQMLSDAAVWEAFYAHKVAQGNMRDRELQDLRAFIDSEEYRPLAQHIQNGGGLEPPEKLLVNKAKVGRKRVVYRFKREENYLLKLLSHLLHAYDGIFAPNLYSFRKHKGVRVAAERILRVHRLDERFVYKLDIHDYFGSVDIEKLLPDLQRVLEKDVPLFGFLKKLLTDPHARYEDRLIEEPKGIMAGVPIASFLANLYLRELDEQFRQEQIPYMRYSDDILVLASTREQLEDSIARIKAVLAEKGLTVNPEKEAVALPHQEWTFLGFSYHEGTVDISEVSYEKLKAKMRRKTRALARWADKKQLPRIYAARAFIKRFNAKLYDNPTSGELTWTRWFFPIINTDKTLRRIDAYMLDCIRYLATDKRNKGRFALSYDEIKALGYRSLVHAYYESREEREGG